MRFLHGFLISIVLACVSAPISAATLQMSWTPPTADVNGHPLTAKVTFNIYERSGIGSNFIKRASGVTTASYVINKVKPNQLTCLAVSASALGLEGPLSTQVCSIMGTVQ